MAMNFWLIVCNELINEIITKHPVIIIVDNLWYLDCYPVIIFTYETDMFYIEFIDPWFLSWFHDCVEIQTAALLATLWISYGHPARN